MMANTRRLLTIEDEASVRRSIKAYFEDSDFEVFEALNGREGLEQFQAVQPDVVLCDLRMPEMDGLQVLEALAHDAPETPFIVVSGTGDMGDAIQALKLGAWDYVTKPIQDMAVLEHSVAKALERSRLVRENREYREHLEDTNKRLKESLRQLEEDETAARAIQFQLLPQETVLRERYHFERYLKTSAYLSGDFLDYFDLDEDRLAFYFADVSGHGVSSAFITVLLNTVINHMRDRHRAGDDDTILHPDRVLKTLNDDIAARSLGKYLTMCYGVIDEKAQNLTWSNGGQFPNPILYDGAEARYLEQKCLPVGLFPKAQYTTRTIPLPDAFILAMFSDGIFDILPEMTLSEKQARLLSQVSSITASRDSIVHHMQLDDIEAPPDDITLLLVKKER